jgi:hypothetical protein
VKTCGALVFYVTDIPTNIEGQLFGTVERFSADGTVVGVTGGVPTNVGATPAIDLNVPGFHVPAGFLPGGQAGDVTC